MSPAVLLPNLQIPLRHLALVLAVWLLQVGASAVCALPSLDAFCVWPSIEGRECSLLGRAD